MLLVKESYYVPVVLLQYLVSDVAIRDIRKLKYDGGVCDFVVTSLHAFIVDQPSTE
jgi:hypothetical protein